MNRSISIIRPANDPTAVVMAAWGDPVRLDIQESAFVLFRDLRGTQADRDAVDSGVEGYVGFDEDLVIPFRDPSDLFGTAVLAGVSAMLLESAPLAEVAERMRERA